MDSGSAEDVLNKSGKNLRYKSGGRILTGFCRTLGGLYHDRAQLQMNVYLGPKFIIVIKTGRRGYVSASTPKILRANTSNRLLVHISLNASAFPASHIVDIKVLF